MTGRSERGTVTVTDGQSRRKGLRVWFRGAGHGEGCGRTFLHRRRGHVRAREFNLVPVEGKDREEGLRSLRSGLSSFRVRNQGRPASSLRSDRSAGGRSETDDCNRLAHTRARRNFAALKACVSTLSHINQSAEMNPS